MRNAGLRQYISSSDNSIGSSLRASLRKRASVSQPSARLRLIKPSQSEVASVVDDSNSSLYDVNDSSSSEDNSNSKSYKDALKSDSSTCFDRSEDGFEREADRSVPCMDDDTKCFDEDPTIHKKTKIQT